MTGMTIKDESRNAKLHFALGKGGEADFIFVDGNVGADDFSNTNYRDGDVALARLFEEFGTSALDILWLGAVIYSRVLKGEGSKRKPMILEEVVSEVDGHILIGQDLADRTLHARLEGFLKESEILIGRTRDKVVWQSRREN